MTTTHQPSRAATVTAVVITVLTALFLLFDSVTKLIRLPFVVDATVQMGFPDSSVRIIGGTLLVCLVLYLVPRTAILGAVLLTGYLGGALCAQLRIEAPLFSTLLFPIYVGVLVWLPLYLRNDLVRRIVKVGR
ncbi:DoxX family protein [Pseudonocardia eucalypti]|uniref:DoxX family protein n=1 Tax=Pseudonocardia eucalypti TaxID=648755 RepID=A0ABP9PSD9_9PSEU|nr:hypothetical protein [Pseudonocardia eucalypti]